MCPPPRPTSRKNAAGSAIAGGVPHSFRENLLCFNRSIATLPAAVNPEAAALIARLHLAPLPGEGGFFRQTWLAPDTLPDGRRAGAAIYFLMTEADFSALHRLRQTEIWHFYAGDPVEHLQLHPNTGSAIHCTLGSDLADGQIPQLLVPAGLWQGARLAAGAHRGWALLGTTTVPAWTETGFELGQRDVLTRDFPAHRIIINALTR